MVNHFFFKLSTLRLRKDSTAPNGPNTPLPNSSSKNPIGAMGNVVPLNKFQSIAEHLKLKFKGNKKKKKIGSFVYGFEENSKFINGGSLGFNPRVP